MKSKLTKNELVEFRTKERFVSRLFFLFAIMFMLFFKAGYISQPVAPYIAFGGAFTWFLLLTGKEYRKYYFVFIPALAVVCIIIGGLRGLLLASFISFTLFFISMWLGKRSYEKQKGISHSW
ncbi:MAG: hypothetical protein CL587_06705 [Alteromonadaceae bacterium]|nr:hypothetical protein [Alteromonadaceae bacterium]